MSRVRVNGEGIFKKSKGVTMAAIDKKVVFELAQDLAGGLIQSAVENQSDEQMNRSLMILFNAALMIVGAHLGNQRAQNGWGDNQEGQFLTDINRVIIAHSQSLAREIAEGKAQFFKAGGPTQ